MAKTLLGSASASLLALLVTGCGGGGGGGTNSTPTPPPTTSVSPPDAPTPPVTTPTTPATTPSTINYNDDEYRISNAAKVSQAISAYQAGATGSGISIAILDSGLTDTLGQFTGRIDSASTDIVSNRGYTDGDTKPASNGLVVSHGTSVAAVAAAGRDGNDILGVAFDAKVMALRTDSVGSCTGSDGCSYADSNLAKAMDYAREHGAKIVNMSLGGSSPGSTLQAAIDRATGAGMIIVISSGNDGNASPDPFAQIASSSVARGLVIIAGAQDQSGAMASFSNKAGAFGQYYLTALGDQVRAFNAQGQDLIYTGTSYAAPTIAGAVALLESAFPNMSASQIVNLLMTTATDAGASGTDSVFGRGLLNIANAFAPHGNTSLAGSTVPISLTDNATLSPAMGDATGASVGAVAFLDGYGRAYQLKLGSTFSRLPQSRPLFGSIGMGIRSSGQTMGRLSVAMTVSQDDTREPWAGFAQAGLTAHPVRAATPTSSRMTLAIDARTQATLGFSSGATSPLVRANGAASAFLIAQTPGTSPGFDTTGEMSFGLRHQLGRFTLGFDGSRGRLQSTLQDTADRRFAIMRFSGATRFGPLDLGIGIGQMREDASVLGARFGSALGGGGATTRLVDMGLGLALGDGWSANASYRQGWTSADTGGMLVNGDLRSNAFAFDLGWTGRASRLGLRVAQPLRVSSGGYDLRLPTGYDYATLAATYGMDRLNLAPEGRELDVEGGYGFAIGTGWIDTNLYMRREPGNIAAADTDYGAAMRFSIGW